MAHPYYPPGTPLSGAYYLPNSWSVSSLVQAFAAGLAALLLLTLVAARRTRPNLSSPDQALVLWFVLSKSVFFCQSGPLSLSLHKVNKYCSVQ